MRPLDSGPKHLSADFLVNDYCLPGNLQYLPVAPRPPDAVKVIGLAEGGNLQRKGEKKQVQSGKCAWLRHLCSFQSVEPLSFRSIRTAAPQLEMSSMAVCPQYVETAIRGGPEAAASAPRHLTMRPDEFPYLEDRLRYVEACEPVSRVSFFCKICWGSPGRLVCQFKDRSVGNG